MGNDKLYKCFVSSTFKDLEDERKQAIEAIIAMEQIPIALDRFSPSNKSDLEVISRVVSECQIYILIIGHRYGAKVPDSHQSFTELEYKLAKANALHILVFMLHSDDVTSLRRKLDPNESKDIEEIGNYKAFNEFRDSIDEFKTIFRKTDNFKEHVILALHKNMPECRKSGYIKESDEAAISLLTSAARNEFIVDIVEELKNFHKLYTRLDVESEAKKELSDLFREEYLDSIVNNNVSLFFESGSTIAYVARAATSTLAKRVRIRKDGKPNIHISTNNVLAYLQLWLLGRIPCSTFPWGPPNEGTYAALYGELTKIQEKKPRYDQRSLDERDRDARKGIERLKTSPFGVARIAEEEGRLTLILGATSGLQLTEEHSVEFHRDLGEASRESLKKEIDQCYGPHIGSYTNMIFKRFLYETGIPIMLFLTGEKFDCQIEAGKCHFVFDANFRWDHFVKEYPLAFCVGCPLEDRARLITLFRKLSFHIVEGTSAGKHTAFIAKNKRFMEHFDQKVMK